MELKVIKDKVIFQSPGETKHVSIDSLNDVEIETLKEMKDEQLNKLHGRNTEFSEIQHIIRMLKIINHILDMRVNIEACQVGQASSPGITMTSGDVCPANPCENGDLSPPANLERSST